MATNIVGVNTRMSGSSIIVKEINNLGVRTLDLENEFTEEDGAVRILQERVDQLAMGGRLGPVDYTFAQFIGDAQIFEFSPTAAGDPGFTGTEVDNTIYVGNIAAAAEGAPGLQPNTNYDIVFWVFNQNTQNNGTPITGSINMSLVVDATTPATISSIESVLNGDNSNLIIYNNDTKTFNETDPLKTNSVIGFKYGNIVTPDAATSANLYIKLVVKLSGNNGTTRVQACFKQFNPANITPANATATVITA